MAARATRLLQASRAAPAAQDVKALKELAHENVRLMLELAPLVEQKDLRAAGMLFEIAYLNLQYQLATQNWILASGVCGLLSGAVAALTHGIAHN
ncbi:MAG: hypothetical protein ACRDNF_23165, partial [Streptosporangiaceae bacterium]